MDVVYEIGIGLLVAAPGLDLESHGSHLDSTRSWMHGACPVDLEMTQLHSRLFAWTYAEELIGIFLLQFYLTPSVAHL